MHSAFLQEGSWMRLQWSKGPVVPQTTLYKGQPLRRGLSGKRHYTTVLRTALGPRPAAEKPLSVPRARPDMGHKM